MYQNDPKSRQHDISIQKGIRLAVRRPNQCARLLAKSFSQLLDDEDWIDATLKFRFCVLFIDNIIDQTVEKEVDKTLLIKIKHMPLRKGLRLLKRYPEEGMKVLVALVIEELRDQQKLGWNEQIDFYDELFTKLFPKNKRLSVKRIIEN